MYLLAMSGKKGAGKDVSIDFLVRNFYELFKLAKQNGHKYHIRKYSIAQKLKDLVVDFFDLPKQFVWGTNEQKNTYTKYKWEDLPHYTDLKLTLPHNIPIGYLTIREFLEEFGTGVLRRIDPDIHINNCLKQIKNENCHVAVINDCRAINEVKKIQQAGGKIIRLTRNPYDSKHEIETQLDESKFNWTQFDAIIDNANLTIDETNQELVKILRAWEWIK